MPTGRRRHYVVPAKTIEAGLAFHWPVGASLPKSASVRKGHDDVAALVRRIEKLPSPISTDKARHGTLRWLPTSASARLLYFRPYTRIGMVDGEYLMAVRPPFSAR
jgi:hypothetical protein